MTGSELSFAKSVLVTEGNELAGPRQKAGQQVRKPWLRVRAVQFASEKNGPHREEHSQGRESALKAEEMEWLKFVDVTRVPEP